MGKCRIVRVAMWAFPVERRGVGRVERGGARLMPAASQGFRRLLLVAIALRKGYRPARGLWIVRFLGAAHQRW